MNKGNPANLFSHMPKVKLRSLPFWIAAATCVGHAQAQTAGKPALEEVIVTAQKQDENIQNVPITMSVLGGEELKNSGIDTQKMLSMATPNVTVNANANFVAPYIRGIGTQYANPGLEPSVATYFNDLYLSRPSAGLMDFHDIQRVEVLKGPQGTLYGRNTTGGAIRIITKDPTQTFEAGAGATLGNYQKKGFDFYVSGPLADGLTGRLSGMVDQNNGWIKNISGGPDLQDRNLTFLHGKLHWDASEKLTVAFMADYTTKRDHEGVAFQPLFSGAPEQVGAAFGAVHSNKYNEYSGDVSNEVAFDAGGAELRVDYQMDQDLSLTSITGYRYNRFHGFADLDATSAPLFKADTQLERTEDTSQEFQLVYDDGDKLNINTGVFFFYESATDNFGLGGQFIDAQIGFPGAFIGGDGGVDVKSGAWYGEARYAFTDEWELMLGLRYTDETKHVQNNFYVSSQGADNTPNKPYLNVIPNPEQEVSFEQWSPKIQLNWRPSYGVMLYASYQEGFKSGGFNMPNPAPGNVPEVKPELLKSTEIGWKTQFDRIRFNGAIFHYDLEDLQIQVTDPNAGITSIRNAGTATVDGIESDLTFAATESLELGGGFGWQKAEFGSVPNGQYFVPCADVPSYLAKGFTASTPTSCSQLGGLGLEALAGNLKGNDLPQAPQLTGYLRGTYTQTLGSSGELAYTLLVSYTDEFSWTADNLYNEPSKTLANANVTWHSDDKHYEVGAYCNNLGDVHYDTHQAPFGASGGWKVPGAPRMYGVRFAYNY